MWRGSELPLHPQSATRGHGTPFSAPHPLAHAAPTPPGASEREGPVFRPVSRAPLLFRQPRAAGKDGYCLDSETASLGLCLSLAQREMDTKNQLECPICVLLSFT